MPRLILALILALTFTTYLPAQVVKAEWIKVAEVEVRSGPSPKYPTTIILRKNAQVLVKADRGDGYLEIKPPQGSVSWVPIAVVTLHGQPAEGRQMFHIDVDKDAIIPIHPGGLNIADGPLPVDPQYKGKFEARRGTAGYVRGNAVQPAWDQRKWYPIDPLPGESRFIPRKAIEEPTKGEIAAAAKERTIGGPPAATPGRDATSLYRDAKKADEAGRIQEAIDLYQQVAAAVSPNEDALANYCATRVYELRRKLKATQGTLASRTNDGKSPAAPPLENGGSSPNPARLAPGTGNPAPAPANNLRSTGVGLLRRERYMIDNKPTYVVLDRNRLVAFYVTPEPGINMEPYVDRWVDLRGTIEARNDVRGGQYMRVAQVYLVK